MELKDSTVLDSTLMLLIVRLWVGFWAPFEAVFFPDSSLGVLADDEPWVLPFFFRPVMSAAATPIIVKNETISLKKRIASAPNPFVP